MYIMIHFMKNVRTPLKTFATKSRPRRLYKPLITERRACYGLFYQS